MLLHSICDAVACGRINVFEASVRRRASAERPQRCKYVQAHSLHYLPDAYSPVGMLLRSFWWVECGWNMVAMANGVLALVTYVWSSEMRGDVVWCLKYV